MKTATRLLLALCLAPVPALAQDAAPAPAAPAPARPAPSPPAPPSRRPVTCPRWTRIGSDPLRERVQPVSGHLFLKKGRFEFSPSATLSVKDAFFTKYILGGTLTYHPMETLGVSLRAGYSLTTVSGAAQICDFTGGGATRLPPAHL